MPDGYLTTHVLDTARGQPAGGMTVSLFQIHGDEPSLIAQMTTNADGRTDAPMLAQAEFKTGTFELVFEAGAYFDGLCIPREDPRFLDIIPIRFGISDVDSHYHVPLLVSPFGYSTYRGS
ncbi:MAG: hydroxyisourate hydrolase [Roseobacter sp.]